MDNQWKEWVNTADDETFEEFLTRTEYDEEITDDDYPRLVSSVDDIDLQIPVLTHPIKLVPMEQKRRA